MFLNFVAVYTVDSTGISGPSASDKSATVSRNLDLKASVVYQINLEDKVL